MNYLKLFETFYQKNFPLIVVDVQPGYEDDIDFDIKEFCEYLNEQEKILYLFNGPDLGYEDEYEISYS